MEKYISVVVPIYNSAKTLRDLVARIMAFLNKTGKPYEIIFVEDGSQDESWSILEKIHAEWPNHVVAIQLMRNFGQHNAIMCGFRHARGQFIVTMDDDLQNPPEEIQKMLRVIVEKEADLVYGVPEVRKHKPWRNLGAAFIQSFYRMVFQLSIKPTSFKIIRRSLMESILSYNKNYTYIDGLLAWNTRRVECVNVEHHVRSQGSSGYSLGKLLLMAFNLFTNFSLIPLQVVSACGVLVALGGLFFGSFYLAQSLFSNIAVPGYASTIVAILVLGGTQLLALGVIGEYIGRLHLNVNRKPQYVKRKLLSDPGSDGHNETADERCGSLPELAGSQVN